MCASFDSRSATRTSRSTSREHDFNVRAGSLMPEASEREPFPGVFLSPEYREQRFTVTSGNLHHVRHDRLLRGNDFPIMVWESNEDGLLDYINRRVYDYSGTTPEQLLGAGWLSIVHPDDRSRAAQRWALSIASGEHYEIEFRIRAHDGTYRWFVVQANAYHDESTDDGIRWLGTCTDIDHCISKAHDSMTAPRLQNDARLHAEGSALLQQLAVTAIHALRQPLTSILSNAQALQFMLRAHSAVDPEIQEILADIVQEDKRAVAILRRLRTPPIAGPIQPTARDINAILREVAASEEQSLTSYGCQLQMKLVRGLPCVHVDAAQLQHVIASLLLARCEAMKHLPAEQRQLIVRTAHRANGVVRVSLTDGAADRFGGQTVTADSLQPDRAGLVLSMCRRVVAAHGGEISIRSNAERGTSVFIDLPVGTGSAQRSTD